jgi:putative membrane protein
MCNLSLSLLFPEIVSQMHQYGWEPAMSGWGHGMGWYWPPVIFGILLVVIIVSIIFFLKRPSSDRGESALEILRKRYAKGEIDRKEFEEKKQDLEN